MNKPLASTAGALAIIAAALVIIQQARPAPHPLEPPEQPIITWSVAELAQMRIPAKPITIPG